MASLAEIRARLAASENNNRSASTEADNAIYAHWNMKEGSSSSIRFLPDGDNNNTYFWVERAMIRLPFNGVKGDMNSRPVQINVPCVEMWGDACPILAEVRTWFKDPSLEDMGRKYWKKRSYIMQGFIRENGVPDDRAPENPIRRLIISPQIFTIIKASLLDPELEEIPTDYMQGLDFRVTKTQKGGYADYSTSKWARKESALTEAEQASIETHGLFDLKDFLPARPNEETLAVIKEMFEASVDGQSFDMDRWGKYFRPGGYRSPTNTPGPITADGNASQPAATPVAQAAPAPVTETVTETVNDTGWKDAAPATATPVAEPKATEKAEDILAMIRARQSAS